MFFEKYYYQDKSNGGIELPCLIWNVLCFSVFSKMPIVQTANLNQLLACGHSGKDWKLWKAIEISRTSISSQSYWPVFWKLQWFHRAWCRSTSFTCPLYTPDVKLCDQNKCRLRVKVYISCWILQLLAREDWCLAPWLHQTEASVLSRDPNAELDESWRLCG